MILQDWLQVEKENEEQQRERSKWEWGGGELGRVEDHGYTGSNAEQANAHLSKGKRGISSTKCH